MDLEDDDYGFEEDAVEELESGAKKVNQTHPAPSNHITKELNATSTLSEVISFIETIRAQDALIPNLQELQKKQTQSIISWMQNLAVQSTQEQKKGVLTAYSHLSYDAMIDVFPLRKQKIDLFLYLSQPCSNEEITNWQKEKGIIPQVKSKIRIQEERRALEEAELILREQLVSTSTVVEVVKSSTPKLNPKQEQIKFTLNQIAELRSTWQDGMKEWSTLLEEMAELIGS